MELEGHLETYEKVTQGVRVLVSPEFLEERSDLSRGIYAYSYTVTVENCGQKRAQLLNRHWVILSGGQQIGDVKGEGVVGAQPVLEPGESFQYTSWTVVNDPLGSMHGAYTFLSEDGEFFNVTIPEFHLIYTESSEIH